MGFLKLLFGSFGPPFLKFLKISFFSLKTIYFLSVFFYFACPFLFTQIAANQEDLFSPARPTRFDPASVLRTIWAMIQICDEEEEEEGNKETQAEETFSDEQNTVLDSDQIDEESSDEQNPVLDSDQIADPNYPDLVPRESAKRVGTYWTDIETIFLLSIFFGTLFLLYLFPPSDP